MCGETELNELQLWRLMTMRSLWIDVVWNPEQLIFLNPPATCIFSRTICHHTCRYVAMSVMRCTTRRGIPKAIEAKKYSQMHNAQGNQVDAIQNKYLTIKGYRYLSTNWTYMVNLENEKPFFSAEGLGCFLWGLGTGWKCLWNKCTQSYWSL